MAPGMSALAVMPSRGHRAVAPNHAESPKVCDIVFGCVDGFDQRRQLEATARRFFISLIDNCAEGNPILRICFAQKDF